MCSETMNHSADSLSMNRTLITNSFAVISAKQKHGEIEKGVQVNLNGLGHYHLRGAFNVVGGNYPITSSELFIGNLNVLQPSRNYPAGRIIGGSGFQVPIE
ncbi:hypothetical protein CEXT_381921 [Caerostris extrusa]|uniref:Uncharacterized protein n=1 Tax=Caerostris extrusa TaxID=172846 RepID=A0AAV4WET8_CAEEX|nr:hypothetical protein CEXT_381921 [Caerostris extrusa]